MIQITNATATLAKSFSAKREKNSDGIEQVVAHLKFSELFVNRDVIDELLVRPIGWSQGALFDDQGAPIGALEIRLPTKAWQARVELSHDVYEPLELTKVDLSDITLALTPFGALLSGQFSWTAAGDEVETLTDLLGQEVEIDLELDDGGQQDLLAPLRETAARHGVESITLHAPGQAAIELVGKIKRADELLTILRQGGTVEVNGQGYTVTTKAGKRIDVWNNAVTALIRRGILTEGLAGQLAFFGEDAA